jgi:serine/threonine protein kinase
MDADGGGRDRNAYSDISISKWSHLSGVLHDSRNIETCGENSELQQLLSLAEVEEEASGTISQLVLQAVYRGAHIVDADAVEIGAHIGTGATMNVFQGKYKGRAVAVKIARPPPLVLNDPDANRWITAIALELRLLLCDGIREHPNIVKLLGFTWKRMPEDQADLYVQPMLIVELASPQTPTLDLLIQKLDPTDFTTKAALISDIAQGLDAIHAEMFIHGDLKPENVLIFSREASEQESKYVAKLSDFGYSDDVELSARSRHRMLAGTEYWSPPECFSLAAGGVGNMVDIRKESRDLYSLGLLVWYVVSSALPFGPDRGPEWAANRQRVLEDKLANRVRDMAASFLTSSLSPLNPVVNIGPDILDIAKFNPWEFLRHDGNHSLPSELVRDDALFSWVAKIGGDSTLPKFEEITKDNIHHTIYQELRALGAEMFCPIHQRSAILLQKIDLQDTSHGKARFIILDELLFRRKVRITFISPIESASLIRVIIEAPD